MKEEEIFARPPTTQADDLEFFRTMTKETPFPDMMDALQRAFEPGKMAWRDRFLVLFPEAYHVAARTKAAYVARLPAPSWDDLDDKLVFWLWGELTGDEEIWRWVVANYAKRVVRMFAYAAERMRSSTT